MSDSINRTMLAPSAVRLFGRVLMGTTGLAAAKKGAPGGGGEATGPGGLGAVGPGSLAGVPSGYEKRSLLLQSLVGDDLRIAHIFAFSYQGGYKPFHVPALFLVHGTGKSVVEHGKEVDPGQLGLAQLDGTITFARDLRFWIYDRADLTLRLDITSGTVQNLVIDAETGGGHGRRVDIVGQDSSFSARLGQGSY